MTQISNYVRAFILSAMGYLESFYTYAMDKVDFHWQHQAGIVNRYFSNSDRLGKFAVDTSGSNGGMATGLITTIIGLVIAFRVFISIMPSTISDAKNVTAAGGEGATWDDSEKSMWSLISLLMIVFGIFIALYAMRQRG